MPRPLAVAITGGIGAGKSEALKAFERHGAATISADEIVHRLLSEDRSLQDELFEAFGVRIRRGDAPERAALAERVFGDPEAREKLERLIHPRVVEAQRAWLDALATRSEPPAAAVVEVPLLYETGAEARFDAVVVVTAPEELRRARKTLTAVRERESRLIPDEQKVRRADFAYVNDGTLEELDAFVGAVLDELRRRA